MSARKTAISVSAFLKRLRPVPVAAVVLTVCLGIVLFLHLVRGHDKAQADAVEIASALGEAVEQHLAGQLRGVATLLDEASAGVLTEHYLSGAFEAHLRERLTAFPEINSLMLVRADGAVTRLAGAARLTEVQKEWLLERLQQGPSGVLIGPPQLEGNGGRRVVVTRLFLTATGTAAMVTLLDSDSIATFLSTMMTAETAEMVVMYGDSQVLAAASNHVERYGHVLSPSPNTVGAVLPVEPVGLQVWVGIDNERAFALWRDHAILESVFFILFCVAIALWARRSDQAWRLLSQTRDGLEGLVAERGVELQRARAELEARARQVSAANRDLQRLSMVAAHHLQEPLRPLVSYSQILARRLSGDLHAGPEVLTHLIQGGKDMKALLKGFQLRVAALAIDNTIEEEEDLAQVIQRAMVDAGTGVAIRLDSLPTLSVPGRGLGEVLVQVFQTLDGLGAGTIVVGARHLLRNWRLEIRVSQGFPAEAEQSVAAKVCHSLAALNDIALSWGDSVIHLDLPPTETVMSDQMIPQTAGGPHLQLAARLQATALIVALASGVAWQFTRERDSAIHAAEVLTSAVANSIDQQISGSIRGIDTILAEVATTFENYGHWSPAFAIRMEAVLRAFPEIRYVGLANKEGQVDTLTWPLQPFPAGGVELSDRGYFRQAQASPGANDLLIGNPVQGRLSGQRTLPMARRLRDENGHFNGIVYASVDPDFYAAFLERVLLDREGGTALISQDGRMIARSPAHAEKFGIDIAASDLFTKWLPHMPRGVGHLLSKADGNDKYVAYRLLSPYPLVVTSGISLSKALADWRREVTGFSLLLTAFALALFGLAWLVDRGLAHIRQQHRELGAEISQRTQGLEAARALSDLRAVSLERLNVQLRDLLGVVTRDLQVPLSSLQDDVQTLSVLLPPHDPQGQGELEYVSAAVARLSALLRDFQRFVSIIGMSAQASMVDLDELVGVVRDMMVRRFGDGVLVIKTAALPQVSGDRTMLRELLAQVFANAIAYRGRDEAVTVTVRARRSPGYWWLEISDDGPGMSVEQLNHDPQAFEMGVGQGDDSTGIGLAICRVITQAHGGELSLSSGAEGGTTVHVSLAA